MASIQKADDAFNVLMGGAGAVDSTIKSDSAKTDAATKDTSDKLSEELNKTLDTSKSATANATRKSLGQYIGFSINPQSGPIDNGQIGMVSIKDTGIVRSYLENPAIKNNFPADLVWAYGIPDVIENKKTDFVALYGLKTKGRIKAPLEGEAVVEARDDFDPTTGQPQVSMRMNPIGARIWSDLTAANIKKYIAIVLDNIVYSAPRVNDRIDGGNSSISGSFSPEEAKDLANILKAGKLPAPAKM